MTSRLAVLAATLLIGPALAGCLWNDGETSPSKTTGAATPTPTPSPSPASPPVIVTPTPGPTTPAADGPCADPGAEPAPGSTATNPRVRLVTSMGTIVAELEREKVPITVGNFLNLTKKGYFDGTRFHRIIENFMIQGGDPLSKDDNPANDGTGGPGYKIPDEFHPALRHEEGVLSMANSGPNTGGSQFFITASAPRHLDDKHAVFGRVVEGMDVVRAVSKVETGQNDRPLTPVTILRACATEPAADGAGVTRSLDAHAVIASKTTAAGRAATFAVIATNLGTVRDAVTAMVTVPDGWSSSMDRPAQAIPAGTARLFIVSVTPPDSASGPAAVTVSFASAGDSAATASASLAVDVGTLGDAAARGSSVEGNYVGMLEDGRLFDTSIEAVAKHPKMRKSAFWGTDAQHRYQPFSFTVGSGVIEGFSELATGAREGEVRTGRMPPEKAYGQSGSDLAGRTLVFELEIVDVR